MEAEAEDEDERMKRKRRKIWIGCTKAIHKKENSFILRWCQSQNWKKEEDGSYLCYDTASLRLGLMIRKRLKSRHASLAR